MRKDEQWKGKKKRVTTKECKRLREEFDAGGFMDQKVLWHIAKTRMLEDRGAPFEKEGDLIREYQTMHDENFLSSWLREDEEGKVEEKGRFRMEPNIRAGKDRLKEEKEAAEFDSERIRLESLSQSAVSERSSEVLSGPGKVSLENSWDRSVCGCCASCCVCCDCSSSRCECHVCGGFGCGV